jgi:hypothetical protein
MGVSLIRAATIGFPGWGSVAIATGSWGSIAGAARVTIIAIVVSTTTTSSTALVAVVSAPVAVTAWGISVVAVC